MRIIFLNVWDGKVPQALTEFIKEQSKTTEAFCFQEFTNEAASTLDEVLEEYQMVKAHKFLSEQEVFNQVTCVKKSIPILESEIFLEGQLGMGLGVYTKVNTPTGPLHICNFHGISRPVDKLDCSERLTSSQFLIDYFKDSKFPVIIGGDFNLKPNTQSRQMFEKNDYRDLVKEYGITNTRNHFVWDRYPNNPRQYYSDYIFVGRDVKVTNLSVPNIEVSDHLPLILTID